MAKKTSAPAVEESIAEKELEVAVEATSVEAPTVELNVPPTPREDPGHNSRVFNRALPNHETTEENGGQEEAQV